MSHLHSLLFLFLVIFSANLFSIPVPNGYYFRQTEINPVTGERVLIEKQDSRGTKCVYSQFVYYPVWTSAKGYYCGKKEYSKTDSYQKICEDREWHYLNWNFDAYRIIAPCNMEGRN